MRNTKFLAAITVAALTILGLTFTSLAANKWSFIDGQWIAVNKDGDAVAEKWVKGDDGIEYYADEDGVWATDTWTYDDEGDKAYYAGADGKKAKGWLLIAETDEDDDDYGKNFYYHFDETTGKVTAPGVKTINGKKYVFDASNRMLTGWVADIDESSDAEWVSLDLTDEDDWALFEDAVYYCGTEDEGWCYSKWHELEAASDDDDAEAGDTAKYWFYFGANNKLYKSDKEEGDLTAYQKTIEGEKYTFDRCGRMLTGFVPSYKASDDLIYMATPASASYVEDDGSVLSKDWIWAVPVSGTIEAEDIDEDQEHWFFGNKNGKLAVNCFTTAKTTSTYWALDPLGIMLSGLYPMVINEPEQKAPTKACTWVMPLYSMNICELDENDAVPAYKASLLSTVSNGTTYTCLIRYFLFGDEETDGSMKTGVQTVNVDGTDVEMRFYKKNEDYWYASGSEAVKSACVTLGHSVDGFNKNCKYYRAGQVQKGDEDNYVSFAPIAATTSSSGTATGKVDVCVPKAKSEWVLDILSYATRPVSDETDEDTYYVDGEDFCLVKKDGTIVKNSSTGVKDADGNKYYVKDFRIEKVKKAD